MSAQAWRVESAYNSELVRGPIEPGDHLYITPEAAARINADAPGTLSPAEGVSWGECINVDPSDPLGERQRVLERELGRGEVKITTLPHARRSGR